MDDALVAALDRELYAFLQEEFEKQGEELYQWYRLRHLPAGIGLSHYDRAIAQFVLDNCSFADHFVEVGAGIGQECMLLALFQRRTVAIETYGPNFRMMERAVARIAERIDPNLPDHMSRIWDHYPERASEYVTDRSILCFPTLSWGLDAEKETALLDSLGAASGVIIGLTYFFDVRRTDEEQECLIDQIRERGFAAPVDVCTWTEWVQGFPPNRIVYFGKASR